MSPAGRGAPAALRLLPGLTPWLLLLLGPHSARGDCGLPPDIPNALPALGGSATFPENSIVTYKCNDGFVKNAGKKDSVICHNSKWSDLKEFCSRSCDVPTRLRFASLQKIYISQNYFPAGSVVDYECRVGYIRNHSLSSKLTCLQNFTWSIPDEFCTRKSCPDPGKIINGQVIIKTDILFGSSITFSCNPGYKLVGTAISYCLRKGTDIGWSAPLPECKGKSSPTSKVTPTPPKPTTVYVPRTKAPTTPLKPTTVDVPRTKAPTTPLKPTTVDVPAAQSQAVPRTTVTSKGSGTLSEGAKAITFGVGGATVIISMLILAKIILDCGKSGTNIYNIDSFAYDASNHWLPGLATEEKRRKLTQVSRILLVSYKFLEAWTQYMQ
ncbi:PREDICTED: complement decay-accelerating factor [Miniopterus natalensis]|uniref:complement decay-accelerating factor n=1 Tax=Miniopterus natalensis TaxID=291302 RepID=UPI0007A6B913|nr:PREDICTED: complement decay-accelerating factor [Miniopterus natalensis]